MNLHDFNLYVSGPFCFFLLGRSYEAELHALWMRSVLTKADVSRRSQLIALAKQAALAVLLALATWVGR